MKVVFLDTVGLLAMWERSDQWHEAASRAMRLLDEEGADFVTTSHVLVECGNAVARKPCRGIVAEFRLHLESAGGVVHSTLADWEDAWSLYSRRPPGGPGIVDCMSFTIMRRLGLSRAFSNDRHFKAAGFETLF